MASFRRHLGDHTHSPPTMLAGRDQERQTLVSCLVHARDGNGHLVLLTGEAGIGKTAVVTELRQTADNQGFIVLVGHCYEPDNRPPYGPWLEIAQLLKRVNESPQPPPPLNQQTDSAPPTNAQQLLDGVSQFFRTLSDRQPVLLILEDLHWADASSLEIVRHLARSVRDLPVLIVVTYRPEEIGHRHPLIELLPELIREPGIEQVDLRPLSGTDVETLVRHLYALGPEDETRLVSHVTSRSEGNPLFLTELLRMLEQEAVLRCESGRWALDDLTGIHVPPVLRQLVEARVAGISDTYLELLEGAAVLGEYVPLPLWRAVTGAPEDSIFAAIDEGERASLLVDDPQSPGVRFRHVIFREALYERMLPTRRWWCHRRTAEVLADMPAPDSDRIAYHFHQANDPRAIGWLIAAARQAEASLAWIEAAERYEAAIGLLEYLPDRAQDQARLLNYLAGLIRYRDPRRGIEYLNRAMTVARSINDDMLNADSQFRRGQLRAFTGDVRGGFKDMQESLSQWEQLLSLDGAELQGMTPVTQLGWSAGSHVTGTDSACMTAYDADSLSTYINTRKMLLAFSLQDAGRYRDAIALARASLDEVDLRLGYECGHSTLFDAHLAIGVASAIVGDVDAALDGFREAMAGYEAVEHDVMAAVAASLWLQVAHLAFDPANLSERAALMEKANHAVARSTGASVDSPNQCPGVLWIKVLEGDWDTAERDALSTLSAAGVSWWRLDAIRVLVEISRNRGEVDQAWTYLNDALPAGPMTEHGATTCAWTISWLLHQAAELALDAAEVDAARPWIDALDTWLHNGDMLLGRAAAWLLRARCSLLENDSVAATALLKRAHEYASDPPQPVAMMKILRAHGQLEMQLRRFAAAERMLLDSREAARACALPFEQATTELELARLYHATGWRDGSRHYLASARTTSDRLHAQPLRGRCDDLERRLDLPRGTRTTVQSLDASSHAAALSDREIEVLGLLAHGLSNREIAARLFISARTVERHIANIYNKLDIHSRAEATAFAIHNNLC